MDVNHTINKLISNPLVRTGAVMLGILLIVLFLMFGAPSVWNKFSNWWWQKGTESDKADIQRDIGEAQTWKGAFNAAIKELNNAKTELAAEKERREALESILADRRLATDQARAEYLRVVAIPPAPVDPRASTEEICKGLERHGIKCEP